MLAGALRFKPFAGEDPVPTEVWRIAAPGVAEVAAEGVALGDAGVARFEADGDLDGFVDIPSAFVSSLCFGGPDRRDVYITTADNPFDPDKGGTVFHARSDVAGVEVGPATV